MININKTNIIINSYKTGRFVIVYALCSMIYSHTRYAVLTLDSNSCN